MRGQGDLSGILAVALSCQPEDAEQLVGPMEDLLRVWTNKFNELQVENEEIIMLQETIAEICAALHQEAGELVFRNSDWNEF